MLLAKSYRESLKGILFAFTLFGTVSWPAGFKIPEWKLTKKGKRAYRGLCELLEVPAWQDQAGIRAYVWNWLRYRPAAAARYADCVQRVAHLILYHLLELSWHSWTSAWLLMPLFYYAIVPDELHWLLDLAVRLSCWLVFRIQKQPADKRVPLAPGVFSAVPRTQSRGPKDGPRRHMQMWSSASCFDPSFGLRSQQIRSLAARPPDPPDPPAPSDSRAAASPINPMLQLHRQLQADRLLQQQQDFERKRRAALDGTRVDQQLQVLAAICKASYESPRVFEEVILPQWSDSQQRVTLYAAFKFRRRYHHHRPAEPSGDFTAYILNISNEAVVVVFRAAQAWSQIPWYLKLNMARMTDPGKSDIQAHAGLLEVLGLTSNLADIKRNSRRGTCAGFQATRCRKGTMRWETLCRGHQGANMQTPYLLLLRELTNLAGTPGMPATAPLYVTGHCMGGALATLFSAALTLRHERKNWRDRFGALVTIGAPRVGNAAFAKMTQRGLRHLLDGGPEKAARLVHCNDIVPHLPPSGFSEGFVHFGSVHALDGDSIVQGGAVHCKGSDESCAPDCCRTLSPRGVARLALYTTSWALWRCTPKETRDRVNAMRRHLGMSDALLNGALVPETLPSFFIHALAPLTGLVGAGFAANSISDYFQILEQKPTAQPLAWLLAHPVPPVERLRERPLYLNAQRGDDGSEAAQARSEYLMSVLARLQNSERLPADPALRNPDQHGTDAHISRLAGDSPPRDQNQPPAGPPRPNALLPWESERLMSLINSQARVPHNPVPDAEHQHDEDRLLSLLAEEASSQSRDEQPADPDPSLAEGEPAAERL